MYSRLMMELGVQTIYLVSFSELLRNVPDSSHIFEVDRNMHMESYSGAILEAPIVSLIRLEDQGYRESVPSNSKVAENDAEQQSTEMRQTNEKIEYTVQCPAEGEKDIKVCEEDGYRQYLDEDAKEKETGAAEEGVIVEKEDFHENCVVKREGNLAELEMGNGRVKKENHQVFQEDELIIIDEEFDNWEDKEEEEGEHKGDVDDPDTEELSEITAVILKRPFNNCTTCNKGVSRKYRLIRDEGLNNSWLI